VWDQMRSSARSASKFFACPSRLRVAGRANVLCWARSQAAKSRPGSLRPCPKPAMPVYVQKARNATPPSSAWLAAAATSTFRCSNTAPSTNPMHPQPLGQSIGTPQSAHFYRGSAAMSAQHARALLTLVQ
jgi:hypothetical protein